MPRPAMITEGNDNTHDMSTTLTHRSISIETSRTTTSDLNNSNSSVFVAGTSTNRLAQTHTNTIEINRPTMKDQGIQCINNNHASNVDIDRSKNSSNRT
jgi:hypothetical protein